MKTLLVFSYLLMVLALALQFVPSSSAQAANACEDRQTRALEEIARQERRQADALERIATSR